MKTPIFEPQAEPSVDPKSLDELLTLLNGNREALDFLVLVIRQVRVTRPAFIAAKETKAEIVGEAERLLKAFNTIFDVANSGGEAWTNLFVELSKTGHKTARIQADGLRSVFSLVDDNYALVKHLIEAAESNVATLQSRSPKGGRKRLDESIGFPRYELINGIAYGCRMAGIKVSKFPNSAFLDIAKKTYELAGVHVDPSNDISNYVHI